MAPEMECSSAVYLKEGYLRKPKTWNRRWFVIREGSPSCLEYYDSKRKSSGKPKRAIDLASAWNIDKRVSAKHKFLIGIYTEHEHFFMAAENESDQTNWVNALRQAAVCHRGPYHMYKHIWHGYVDTRELEDCDVSKKEKLHGPHRCCFTEKTIVFVPTNSNGGCQVEAQNYVEVALASIRLCGYKDATFFFEPGRSSTIGTGKLSIELDDSAIAEHMHHMVLKIWHPQPQSAMDDLRPRSHSYGSNSGRPGSTRSRQNYCPPPSQVGLGTKVVTQPIPLAYSSSIRERCGSCPANKPSSLAEECDSRLRTSSDGVQSSEKARIAARQASLQRKSGLPSTQVKTHKFCRPYKSAQRPGSTPNSIISSADKISSIQDYPLSNNLQCHSDNSADEYVDVSASARPHRIYINSAESAPPPPDTYPETLPFKLVQSSHSRSQSLDDNLSYSTAASSLSTSPYTGSYMSTGTSPSQDESFLSGTSPVKGRKSGASTPTSDYAPMSAGDYRSGIQQDYMLMTPGRLAPNPAPVEDKSGYVPMQPLKRSNPREILARRRSSLNGSYSPASPNRSPDKQSSSRKHFHTICADKILPHSCPSQSASSPSAVTTTSKPFSKTQMPTHNVLNENSNSEYDPSRANQGYYNSDEYAFMGPRVTSPKSQSIDDYYLPMSPMTCSTSNTVLGNVISIAASVNKRTTPPVQQTPKYPHQRSLGNTPPTNSTERRSKERRRNTVSVTSALSFRWPRQRDSKHVRRSATRVSELELRNSVSEPSSTDVPPSPRTPGGEYVSIDYQKAKKQIGPDYVSLTYELDVETCPLKDANRASKVDSNRNILPNGTIKDENQYPRRYT